MRLLALGALGWAGQEWLLQSPLLLAGGVGALLAWVALFWLERRSSQAEWLGALGLLYDMTLAGVGVWLLAHPQAWWLLFVPAIYAARQYAAWHALMGAFLAPLTVGVIASVAPERFADTATLWGWGAGLLGGHLALAWVAYRPATTPSPEVMEQVTRVLEQTESAHRELRHSYRELAHHYRRLQENLETLNDVVELFTALRQATTPTEAYRLILERLRSRFGASGAALYLADETGFHLRAALGVGSLARLQGTVRVDAPPQKRAPGGRATGSAGAGDPVRARPRIGGGCPRHRGWGEPAPADTSPAHAPAAAGYADPGGTQPRRV